MLRDLGSRDAEFIEIVKSIRYRLLELGGVKPGGKLLVIVNGAYGRRIVQIAQTLKIDCLAVTFAEDSAPALGVIETVLTIEKPITHVAVIHCETTTGLINPIKAIGRLALTTWSIAWLMSRRCSMRSRHV